MQVLQKVGTYFNAKKVLGRRYINSDKTAIFIISERDKSRKQMGYGHGARYKAKKEHK